MRDQGIIYGGLIVFLGLITLPFTYNLATGKSSQGPELKLPAQEQQCVAPIETMKSSHMQLLLDWRDQVVRNNVRKVTTADHREFTMSLSGTCLQSCHTAKSEFCDRCHTYVGVEGPYCMDCHVDPQQSAGGGL